MLAGMRLIKLHGTSRNKAPAANGAARNWFQIYKMGKKILHYLFVCNDSNNYRTILFRADFIPSYVNYFILN